MNIRFRLKAGNSLTSRATISFSSQLAKNRVNVLRTLLYYYGSPTCKLLSSPQLLAHEYFSTGTPDVGCGCQVSKTGEVAPNSFFSEKIHEK
jgi:hypothetical protein